jgi:hypothetical protein
VYQVGINKGIINAHVRCNHPNKIGRNLIFPWQVNSQWSPSYDTTVTSEGMNISQKQAASIFTNKCSALFTFLVPLDLVNTFHTTCMYNLTTVTPYSPEACRWRQQDSVKHWLLWTWGNNEKLQVPSFCNCLQLLYPSFLLVINTALRS